MDIFKKLKKIFSTGILVSDFQFKEPQLKIINRYKHPGMSREYTKLLKGKRYTLSDIQSYAINRLVLYRDYDLMDNDPIMASALNIYSDQSTTKNQNGDILQIICQNQEVKQRLENLFFQRLNFDFYSHLWIRNFCKYGDLFLFLILNKDYGVVGAQQISSYDIQRVQNDGGSLNDDQDYHFVLSGTQRLPAYQIAHFRMLSDSNYLPYGRSILQPVRRTWKQLTLMIDAMLVHRIMRAPSRFAYYIETGNLPPEQRKIFIQDIANSMRRTPYRDPNTGQLNLKYNMMNMMQDYFIPKIGQQDATKIQSVGGLQNVFTQDIQFIKDYLLSGLMIPKAFLTFDQTINAKATLSNQDLRFSRTITRVQRNFLDGLYYIALIHLYMNNIVGQEQLDFQLRLTNPNTIQLQQQMQLLQNKINLAQAMKNSGYYSDDYICKQILEMSQQQIRENRINRIKDLKFKSMLDKIQTGQYGQQGQEQQVQGEESEEVEYGYDQQSVSEEPQQEVELPQIEIQQNQEQQDKLIKKDKQIIFDNEKEK